MYIHTSDIYLYKNLYQIEQNWHIILFLTNLYSGVQLLRSSDGVQFFRIDEIQGICGGSEFTEHYILLDETPLQATTNHYKLALGVQGESQVIQLNFVPLNAGFNVFPNPVQDWAVLKWDNPTEIQFSVDIYNIWTYCKGVDVLRSKCTN